MPLIAIPNVSEGCDRPLLEELAGVVAEGGARLLDLHTDRVHNRSVFTLTAPRESLVESLLDLTRASQTIDLETHRGVHPRLGTLDVCPFVPHETGMSDAVRAAHDLGRRIADELALPVYYYGRAALRPETEQLPAIRRGGLETLIARVAELPPDEGPQSISPHRGVACVGARDALIAFNVWIEGGADDARSIAREIRVASGGLPGVRALGWPISKKSAQVSMNLVDPERTGIEDAFAAVQRAATARGVSILHTEIVGLVPRRYAPNPDAQAARLLLKPGRTLEQALAG
ncbi:glutamate formimidoyltransferase [soil metagenome]